MNDNDMMTIAGVAVAAFLLLKYASGQGQAQAAAALPYDWTASGSQQDAMLAAQWPG